ncbi:MAG: PEP-CTERM sorting domain-containing protein [Nitrospiraceae bacterium]|nr:PEP-CTERM sorting domain-containing protein [Nitrospiraceae bacterium]
MKKFLVVSFAALLMIMGFTGRSFASLAVVGNGTFYDSFHNYQDPAQYQLVYDQAQNITWYDYSNIDDTWQDQTKWAGGTVSGTLYPGLTVQVNNGPSVSNISNWSLPSLSQVSNLYTEVGNSSSSGLISTGPFQNLTADGYWTGTENIPGSSAYYYYFSDGYLNTNNENSSTYMALAVHSGNVVTPIPGTLLLFGSGLAGLAGFRRKLAGWI